MPLLFQRRLRSENRPVTAQAIRELLEHRPGPVRPHRRRRPAAAVRPPRLPPDADHRRDHARHAAAHRPARRRAPRHQHHHGIQGRLPRGSHQRPPGVHRPPPRTAPQRRNTAPRPTPNGRSSSATSSAASSPSATAAAPTEPAASTSTAASAARSCASTPPSGPGSRRSATTCTARIAEAEREGWAGEAEGLKVSLAAADAKLAQVDAARRPPAPPPSTSACPPSATSSRAAPHRTADRQTGQQGTNAPVQRRPSPPDRLGRPRRRTDGEPLAIVLRPGNAGSNTAADHIEAAGLALAQLPRHLRRKVAGPR